MWVRTLARDGDTSEMECRTIATKTFHIICSCFFSVTYYWKYLLLLFTIYIHTYLSRFIPEGVVKASHKFVPQSTPIFQQSYFGITNTLDLSGGKPVSFFNL
jgi:hypothetical protein